MRSPEIIPPTIGTTAPFLSLLTRVDVILDCDYLVGVRSSFGFKIRNKVIFGNFLDVGVHAVGLFAYSQCDQQAEWRFKDRWGVLARADWFSGTCEGEPLDVAPPSVGDRPLKGRGLDEDERYNQWVRTRSPILTALRFCSPGVETTIIQSPISIFPPYPNLLDGFRCTV